MAGAFSSSPRFVRREAPLIYMRTQHNNCGQNSGTGGDFTINGSPGWSLGPVPMISGFGLVGGGGLGARGRMY